MKVTYKLLVALLMVGFSSGVRAQISPESSVTPHATASKSQGAIVLWHGKAPPGWGGVVTEMKLLAPGVGWAERAGQYYWTSDNGANWRDITPPGAGEKTGLFFLDTQHGWAVINHPDELESGKLRFDMACTADAGTTWSKMSFSLPAKTFKTDLAPLSEEDFKSGSLGGGAGAPAFADLLNGWLAVQFGYGPNTWWTFLLVTSDGGRTWRRAMSAPELQGADMLPMTATEGWLAGSSEGGPYPDLYVTRDGTMSWQKISLPIPKKIARTDFGPATCSLMDLPKFENSKHGFLEASCSTYADGNTHINYALFATNDGGRTWKLDRVVANANEYQAHLYGCSAVAGSEWIFVASPGPDLPPFAPRHNVLITDDVIVTKVGAGATIDARLDAADLRAALPAPLTDSRPDLRFYGDIRQCSFATPSDGWVIVGEGDLKSTTDGGKTWKEIVPGPKPHVIQPYGN
jgi:photosystem II stability/assembly factor-like uncharacterized protein